MDMPWDLEARGLRGLRSFLVSWQVQTFLATLLNKEGGGEREGERKGGLVLVHRQVFLQSDLCSEVRFQH